MESPNPTRQRIIFLFKGKQKLWKIKVTFLGLKGKVAIKPRSWFQMWFILESVTTNVFYFPPNLSSQYTHTVKAPHLCVGFWDTRKWYQECSICPNLAIKPQTPSFTQPPLQVLTVSWPQILCSTFRGALLCLPQRTEVRERRYLFNRHLVCTFMWQVAFGDGWTRQTLSPPSWN